ncbi:hypothetical protein KQX54_015795 [Cotesia glomerata]|uniref:Uncharacterized protein n=1 Tax=Cotesia glomerata TaxID=32391 RepID=A0AAV7INH6_COTGL|nr:hypothetical protein KQX54_015795 [Cotesia glomerata]
MYTNPFNRKHSTIRQVLDRFFDPKKPIRRSESVSSSGSASSKSSSSSFGSIYSRLYCLSGHQSEPSIEETLIEP